MKFSNYTGHIYALITIFIWDFTYIIGKFLLKEIELSQLLVLRFILAVLVLSIITIREKHKFNLKDEKKFFVLGLFISVYFIGEVIALKFTSASNIGFIVGVLPLVSVVVAHIFTDDEKLTINVIVGILISFVGLCILVFFNQNGFSIKESFSSSKFLGDFAIFLGVISWSFYSLKIKQNPMKEYSSWYISKKSFIYVAIISIIFSMFSGVKLEDYTNLSLNVWKGIIYLVLIASCLAFVLWGKAIQKIGMIMTSNYLFVSPLNIAILAYIFLGEQFYTSKIIGGLFVLIGIFISKLKKGEKNE